MTPWILQELKDEFFAKLNVVKAKPIDEIGGDKKEVVANKPKKPVLKKKVAADDPFASDSDADPGSEQKKGTPKGKVINTNVGAKRAIDSDDEEDNRPKKKH